MAKIVHSKFYGTINGEFCDNWDLVFVKSDWGRSDYSGYTFISQDVEQELVDPQKNIDSNFVPKFGDDIYVAPKCPLALADIRHSYSVKKAFDTGVCNVITPRANYWSGTSFSCSQWFVDGLSKKVYIAVNGSEDTDLATIVKQGLVVTEPKINEAKVYSEELYIKAISITPIEWSLLKGTNKTPNILVSRLPLKKENELTMDSFRLVLQAAKQDYSRDNIKNLVIQLQAMNQTNWQQYRRSLAVFFQGLISNWDRSYWCGSEVFRTSRLPKAVKEMIRSSIAEDYPPFSSPDDMRMARALVEEALGKKIPEYVRLTDMMRVVNCSDSKIEFDAVVAALDPIVCTKSRVENVL